MENLIIAYIALQTKPLAEEK